MIGIVGPRDSVALVQKLALGRDPSIELLYRPYRNIAEAYSIARSVEPFCEVILCTGQVPFHSLTSEDAWSCEVQVMAHSGADLYRMIGMVLKESGSNFPRVSIDAMDAEVVRAVFSDMSLPIPKSIIPVIDGTGAFIFEGVDGTARAHETAIERGLADAVFTCLSGTYRLLERASVPAWRVRHSRVTIVEALERARLAEALVRSRGSAIAVVRVDIDTIAGANAGKRSPGHPELDRLVTAGAQQLSSQVVKDGHTYVLTTTQAAVREMLGRHREGQKSIFGLGSELPGGLAATIGIGIGGAFLTARDSADKAWKLSASTGDLAIMNSDGKVEFVSLRSGQRAVTTLQEVSTGLLDLSQRTGLGPLSLRRVADALGLADEPTVTAQKLGELYGVKARSARRILSALASAGYASEVGLRTAVGAGRPHVVYEIDRVGLLQVLANG